jgi:hypothetical protein
MIVAMVGGFAVLWGGIYAVTRPIQQQLAEILRRLARIETKLEDHFSRITRLEEKSRVVQISVGRRGKEMVRWRRRASIREMPIR